MMQMQDIKDRVTKVLDNKGVLSRLKAELRANVFLAINDQDIQQGGIGLASKSDAWNREQLLQDPSGAVVVELVREFLAWCKLQFTIPVFEPEMQLQYAALDRHSLQQQLGLSGINGDTPLLLQLLQQYTALANQHATQSSLPAASQQPPTAVAYSQPPLQQHIPDGLELQQQHNQHQQPATNDPAAGTLGPASALHMAAAAKQPSKSASIMEEIDMDENLTSTRQHGEPDEDEEYAAVFLAAQGPCEPDDEVSSTDTTPRQQVGRPLLWTQPQPPSTSSSNEQQVLSPPPPPAAAAVSSSPAHEPSDSAGDLDLSIELHDLSDHEVASPPSQELQIAPHAAPPPTAETIPAVVTDGPSTSQSLSHSLVLQQHSVVRSAGPASAAVPAGRLSPLEPLAPLRAGKLAPLAPIARPSGLAAAHIGLGKSTASSEGRRDELRRAGLLQSPDAPVSQHSTEASNLGGKDSPGNTSSDRIVDAFVQQETAGLPAGSAAAAADASEVDLGLYSDGEGELQSTAESAAEDYVAAAAQNPGRPVYGSTAGADLSSSDEESSDDFGIEVQRQLFEAARRQLSQGSAEPSTDQQQQQMQQRQQPPQQQDIAGQTGQQQQQPGHDDDADDFGDSDLDIPEDFSLPLEGLDEDDEDIYAHMLEGAGQQTAAHAAVAADSSTGRGYVPQQQLGMSLGDTGLSLSDIGNLPTAADFQLDADEF